MLIQYDNSMITPLDNISILLLLTVLRPHVHHAESVWLGGLLGAWRGACLPAADVRYDRARGLPPPPP